MELLRIDMDVKRVWVLGKRIHHGAVGFVISLAGMVLMRHDIKDFPWLSDND